ncbi:aldolase [Paenibacillus sp. LjRoot153]|uniref:HPr kinase/phosphorylase n=1 Tax=Paenibacillus sp. LjRoot153 TaxID=3342270 RepID=UPI003ECFB2F1
MLEIEKKLVYKAFGLSISSDIQMPELYQVHNYETQVDIEIVFEDLSKLWSEHSAVQKDFIVHENKVMFKIPQIATFCVQSGNKIVVQPIQDADEDEVRLLILGTCMGIILMQRKIFPLHGSAIAIDGKAYAIIGDSGAGKSTLAAAFLRQGYQLLTDDVIAVTLTEDNTPIVTPSYPQQKLWIESLTQFGMESSGYRSIYQRETKFAIPVASQFTSQSLPLTGIFELVKGEGDTVKIQSIESLGRLQTLFLHTYRNFLIPCLGLVEWHFTNSSQILNKVDMYQLQRPTTTFTAQELVSIILNSIHGGKAHVTYS